MGRRRHISSVTLYAAPTISSVPVSRQISSTQMSKHLGLIITL